MRIADGAASFCSDRLRAAPRRRHENLFERKREQFGDAEGERQRGIVFAGLDRIDALARDFEAPGQVLLAPAALCSQEAEAVFHQQPAAPRETLFTTPPMPRPKNQAITIQ